MDLKNNEWETSYSNKDNYVFYPNEEVIRFVSKYVKKKTGINSFTNIATTEYPKILDLGCGIGRHVKFLLEYNCDVYGIDFSNEAISKAKEILSATGYESSTNRLEVGDCSSLPYQDSFFDNIVSHGVLDSMPFETAKASIKEMYRCLKPGSLAYIDVISGDNSNHSPEYAKESIVETTHEKGTIQSYFNWSKIKTMLGDHFTIEEIFLIKRSSQLSNSFASRYHMVIRSRKS